MNANRILSRWLTAVVILTLFMIALGGLTRLTRSGLSITEWKPILGALPPLGQVQWQEAYEKYAQTPEYRLVNTHISMGGFQFIYFMEWFHRLIGRVIGLVLLTPFLLLIARRLFRREHVVPAVVMLGLLAFQGLLGWLMVASGLVDIPRVSHIRLTIHLLAALLFLSVVWAWALRYRFAEKPLPHARSGAFFALSVLLAIGVLLQIAYGGFTAGLRAGTISTTWPLYAAPGGASMVPPGLWVESIGWRNLVENPVTVHFVHRTFAWLVFAGMIALCFWGLRQAPSRPQKVFLWHLSGLGILQMLLGVGVIVWHVPVALGSLHQMVAIGIYMATFYLIVSSRLEARHREG